MFPHGKEIGQNLGGMEFVGEAVPHRNPGVLRQFLHNILPEAAVLDAVKHAAQHPGGVPHAFLDTYLRTGGAQVGDMGALVVGGHLEGAAGAGRGLFEDKGYVLAREAGFLGAFFLGALQIGRQIQQVLNFFRGKVQQLKEASIL